MKLYEIIILMFLGLIVLLSYFTYLRTNTDGNYFTHPFWFNIDTNVVKFLTFFQILAMIGFIVAIGSWLINPPKGGIMEKYLFLTLMIFLISAAIWPYATNNNMVWLSVLVVVLTAISSILLLAGSIEEDKPRLIVLCGLLFLCITTVLGDAVIWNANYIKSNQKL
jgi:hypothetical protein